MYNNIKPDYQGKVRDVFDLGNSLILVSTDRISAFDVVFKETIPNKGKILNKISLLWFDFFKDIPNHLIEREYLKFPEPYCKEEYLKDRAVLVKKCLRINYECVVRGYLSGSAFMEYKKQGTIAGKPYPKGWEESSQLPEPIFTPARKNDHGHDENIPEEVMQKELGDEIFQKLKETSIYIYNKASQLLRKNGIILADTKFEFGLMGNTIILIDELLTPDSSRFWSQETYQVGVSPPSLDKQILRNYLQSIGWDKNPPPPLLPEEIQNQIVEKYQELERKIEECILQK